MKATTIYIHNEQNILQFVTSSRTFAEFDLFENHKAALTYT